MRWIIINKGESMIRFLSHFLILTLLPASALAVELDFYTFGGFQETVDAFKRIALIFNNDIFIGIFYVFAVLGLFIGYAIHSGNQVLNSADGQAKPSMRVLFTVAIGIAIFQGTVMSKGEITVYDEQLNQFETVQNIPDIIVLASGFTNLAERAVTEIVDNSSATTFKDYAGGVNYKLIYDAVTKTTSFKQFYAIKSLQKFYQECSLLPLSTNTTDFNLESLKSDTKDIFGYLEKLKSPSSFTVYYTSTNKEGGLVSCSQAYDLLKPIFTTDTSYTDYLNSICESNGFKTSVAAQLARCKVVIEKAVQGIYSDTTLDYISVMKNYLVGLAITDAVQQENPDIGTTALSNRAMLNDGIGTSVAANNWLPTIKSVVTSIILTITPILLLFLVTGLAWKVLNIIFSLFAWLAIWGVCDALLLQSITDQTYATFTEVVNHDMGLTAIMLTPGAAMKSLGIMGEARGMGITIASFIAVTLFRINAYAFSQVGQNFTNQINKHGEQSSQIANNSEQGGQFSEQVVNGNSYIASMSHTGYEPALSAATFNQTSQIMTGASISNSLGGGSPFSAAARSADSNTMSTFKGVRSNEMLMDRHGGLTNTAESLAGLSAGSQSGSLTGTEKASMPGATLFDTSERTSEIETEKRVGDSLGIQNAALSAGVSVSENSAKITEQNTIMSRGQADNIESVVEQVQQSNPDITVPEIAKNYAAIQNREPQGRLLATDGDSSLHTTQSQEQSVAGLYEWQAYKTALETNDINVAQAAWAKGSIQGFADYGRLAAYTVSGGERISQAETDMALRSAFKGEASHNAVMQQEYGNYESFYSDLAQHSHLMEYSGVRNFMALAESIGIDQNDLAVAMTGQSSLALSGEQAQILYDKGILTGSQYSSLEEGGSWAISQSLGNILTSSSSSGQSAVQDSSSSLNNQQSITGGLYFAQGTTTFDYFTRDDYALREDHAQRVLDGDENTRQAWIQNMASSLSLISSNTRLDTENQSANLGAGLPGGSAGKGASIGVAMSNQDTESTSYNIDRAIVSKIIDGSKHWVETSGIADEQKAKMLSDKVSSVYEEVYEVRESAAKDSTKGVDINSDLSILMERHGLPYNHLDLNKEVDYPLPKGMEAYERYLQPTEPVK
ncbi:conjugal transfer protein TraG N-terminal domain-containing protein [Endozoicomonas sp. ONNA1]|uniref:conjugal transfer protein TraG N-terminal domain-containing protein n=1 Tax=Endozoicomonas sp. ONNA1 TaxID=2828740 RepID=UPI0027D33413|nr:conjugal transfer protein TraG N-terminal domain-containing protein [Endozoicomonas sp. ONNA1]